MAARIIGGSRGPEGPHSPLLLPYMTRSGRETALSRARNARPRLVAFLTARFAWMQEHERVSS